ncbi:MAG: hypothetical protein GY856_32090 [bacterium]|nr:hypothetical protein [bacterium]
MTRPRSSHRREVLPCLLLLILGGSLVGPAALAEDSPHSGPEAQRAAAVRAHLERILAEREKISTRYDRPGEAEKFYAMKRLPESGKVDPIQLYDKARRHMRGMPRYSTRLGRYLPIAPDARVPVLKAAQLGTWEPLGPGNIGGRTRALILDPDQPRIRYAAGVSGGIWKTVDGGRNWRPLADLMPNIAVNSLVMDPTDSEVLYAGTGEGYFREIVRETSLPLRGAGIFKTEDGGESWTRLESTWNPAFRWVNDLVISPNDPRRIYAATRTGVWRSRNGGKSWKQILDPEVMGGCLDLALRTDRETDDLLAACGTFERATVYRHVNAAVGREWTPVLSETGMGRTSLAIAPSNQDIVYALSTSYVPGPEGRYEGGLHAVFRSDQGGAEGSWTATVRNTDPVKLNTLLLTNPVYANFLECEYDSQNFFFTLGWYTNVIAVDPVDPDVVWAGGVDLFRSDDGGRNWGVVTYWWDSPPSAHADQHVIVFHPDYDGVRNQAMFLGGDGGLYRTGNARAAKATGPLATCDPDRSDVRWYALNHNYGVTQFYHGAPYPDGRRYLGGAQDNGTVRGGDAGGIDGWSQIVGGDGGYVAVDPNNTDVIYVESQGLAFRKSTNGGASFFFAIDGIEEQDGGDNAIDEYGDFLFIVPFIMDPTSPRRLWLGGHRLWRTSNGALFWTQASAPLSAEGKVSALAIAPSDPDRMVVGLNDGSIHRTDRALSSYETTVWPSVRPRSGYVSWLAFDPHDAEVVYATYATFGGKHVYVSRDGGASWRQIDGNGPRRLPNLPVHSIVVDPTDTRRLFLGTDLGVFVSTSGGLRWAVESTGFAKAVTESLALTTRPDGTAVLFAFTHGRGAWRVEIADPGVQ